MTNHPPIRPGCRYYIANAPGQFVAVYVISTDTREATAIIKAISPTGELMGEAQRCPFKAFARPLDEKELH